MALANVRWTDQKSGAVVPGTYVRVASASVGKVSQHIPGSAGWRLLIAVQVWASEEARQFESHRDKSLCKVPIATPHYTGKPFLDEHGRLAKVLDNAIDQAYHHLKSLPEFEGARDV